MELVGEVGFFRRYVLNKKAWQAAAVGLGILFVVQIAYYAAVYGHSQALPASTDVVLVYSGGDDRTAIARHWAGEGIRPLFIFSGWDYSFDSLRKTLKLDPARMKVEGRALTTDQ